MVPTSFDRRYSDLADGFLGSVTPDYLPFQIWESLQVRGRSECIGALRGLVTAREKESVHEKAGGDHKTPLNPLEPLSGASTRNETLTPSEKTI
ncbi:hypothetical protein QJS10_CPB11g01251 [Acorus calamus]|uniref:Uncharacterized protein n=1 Tax=Acorus calamus TaxID=4465 RepID=A0AAV9DSC6_ACOCL|nr:hypothetical protein QJS10_CPB11g01251 [Acorus calamus]